jgi:hypothetical protein
MQQDIGVCMNGGVLVGYSKQYSAQQQRCMLLIMLLLLLSSPGFSLPANMELFAEH